MALSARPEWKETLFIMNEHGQEFAFDCGWGVTPAVAYIPSPEDWQACVPNWLVARRDEVISAMKGTGHVVHEGYYPPFPAS